MNQPTPGAGRTLISVIIPVYNEEANIPKAYKAVMSELAKHDDLDAELIFTDNHSTDRSFEVLQGIAEQDPRVKVLRFSRNFGFNKSILTGYRQASGGAAIQIDCDLEDPPELFHEFIRLWRQGHDVVVGVRAQRTENVWIGRARRAFYTLLNQLSETPHVMDSGDFRLIDRKILDQLRLIHDPYPYVRGLVSELATRQATVPFSRQRRQHGESKFPLRNLIRLAMEGVYAHSTLPLKLATYIGIAVSLITVLVSGGYLTAWLLSPQDWPAGFATTTILILFGISLNALFLGIIGEYIARIYQQVRTRPTVIVERALNIEKAIGIYPGQDR